jgi:hypothetical protein
MLLIGLSLTFQEIESIKEQRMTSYQCFNCTKYLQRICKSDGTLLANALQENIMLNNNKKSCYMIAQYLFYDRDEYTVTSFWLKTSNQHSIITCPSKWKDHLRILVHDKVIYQNLLEMKKANYEHISKQEWYLEKDIFLPYQSLMFLLFLYESSNIIESFAE